MAVASNWDHVGADGFSYWDAAVEDATCEACCCWWRLVSPGVKRTETPGMASPVIFHGEDLS